MRTLGFLFCFIPPFLPRISGDGWEGAGMGHVETGTLNGRDPETSEACSSLQSGLSRRED